VTDNPIRHSPVVPVVIVGAGPTGITAATLLAQYGLECLVLDRWPGVYPQPRAVHLDDEIYRVIARLGIAEEFAAISRPTLGLRLLDNRSQRPRVLAEFNRDPARSPNGFPQANMFDQPELEALLRANLKRYPNAQLRGDAEVTALAESGKGIRVTFTDRSDGQVHQVEADYLLGCDGANSMVRAQIGSAMRDLKFEQRWLVADVAGTTDLQQWDGVHQVCDPTRAGTYMRIGPARYRWEFQLLPGESAGISTWVAMKISNRHPSFTRQRCPAPTPSQTVKSRHPFQARPLPVRGSLRQIPPLPRRSSGRGRRSP